MMNDLLKELNEKSIRLTLENGKLKYFGPEQNITPELLQKLKNNKESLISYLSSVENTNLNDFSTEEKSSKIQNSISDQFDDFEQLIHYFQNNAYKFSIENAKLIYNTPNQELKEEIANAVKKHYRHLYQFYWPIPNANLTPIQPEGSCDPFFIVHGEQSTPFLKDSFGTELPLFDYFHQSYDGSPMKYQTVEEVAEFYLQQLLSIKNDGNFLLGGYSFGGLVAYEMAHRLTQMGKNVKLLVLIDTSAPDFDGYIIKFNSFKRRLKYYIINPIREGFSSIINRFYCKSLLILGKQIPANLRTFYIVDNYTKNSVRYHPPCYNGRMHLITGMDNAQSRDPFLGWKKYIKEDIELVLLPGDHHDLVKNPISAKLLADKIKDFIRDILA